MKYFLISILISFSLCLLWAGEKQNNTFANGDFVNGTRNYLCKKCVSLVCMRKSPAYTKCPKGGVHEWTDLGECGANPYQCAKCATLVRSKKTPSYTSCPSGGVHDWKKL